MNSIILKVRNKFEKRQMQENKIRRKSNEKNKAGQKQKMKPMLEKIENCTIINAIYSTA